jgi:GNAT superfamily N-acetyltransferase
MGASCRRTVILPCVVEVRFEQVADEQSLADWRRVHNEVVPTHLLTLDQVAIRSRHHRLELAYVDGVAAGNSTVRRPTEEEGAMVIARVLPSHRRRGVGTALYTRGLEVARAWADDRPIETVVLASNEAGLAFALARGFVEVERYLLPGDSVPYVALTLDEG